MLGSAYGFAYNDKPSMGHFCGDAKLARPLTFGVFCYFLACLVSLL